MKAPQSWISVDQIHECMWYAVFKQYSYICPLWMSRNNDRPNSNENPWHSTLSKLQPSLKDPPKWQTQGRGRECTAEPAASCHKSKKDRTQQLPQLCTQCEEGRETVTINQDKCWNAWTPKRYWKTRWKNRRRKRGIKLIGWHGRKPVTPEVILKGVNKWKERSLSGLSCTTQNVSGLLAQKRPSLWMEDDSSSFTGTFCNVNELMDQALRTTGCQCTREERDWRTQRHLWRNLMNHWKPWPDPHRAWRAGELGTSAQELVDAAQALPDWREGVHNKKNWQHIATTCEV